MRSDIRAALDMWSQENETTMAVLRTVPEGCSDLAAISGDCWKLGELIWHICVSEWYFCVTTMGALQTEDCPVPPDSQPASVSEMMAALQKSHAMLAAVFESKDEGWMDEEVQFYGAFSRRLDLLHLMCRHEAHHRGQLSIYILLAGSRPPTIYGAAGVNLEDAG